MLQKKDFQILKLLINGLKKLFLEIKTDKNTALIALTHDPKIDDPALQYALKKNFFILGLLGSKKTHANRCQRLVKKLIFLKKILIKFLDQLE